MTASLVKGWPYPEERRQVLKPTDEFLREIGAVPCEERRGVACAKDGCPVPFATSVAADGQVVMVLYLYLSREVPR